MSRTDDRGPAGDPRGLRLTSVRSLIALAGSRTRVGLINLSDEYSARDGLARPDPLHTGVVQPLTRLTRDGKALLLQALSEMKTTHEAGLEDGFTYMSRALSLAGRVLADSSARQRYVFLVTDGDVTGEDPEQWPAAARRLQAAGIKVVVFQLGASNLSRRTVDRLSALHDDISPSGGRVELVDNPDDLLAYYLESFVVIDPNTYLNQISLPYGATEPTLSFADWMAVDEAFLIVPAAGGSSVTGIVRRGDGKDVLASAREAVAPGSTDRNVEVLALTRDQVGALEGDWSIRVARDVPRARLLVRSRVRIDWTPIARPVDAERAVVAVSVQEGPTRIPRREVLARGGESEDFARLIDGAIRPGIFSGTIARPEDGRVTVRVRAAPDGAAAAAPARPPRLEKTFVAPTAAAGGDSAAIAMTKSGDDRKLLPGDAVAVTIRPSGPCRLDGVAVRQQIAYARAAGLPAPPAAAPYAAAALQDGAGTIRLVPARPGTATFTLDHALLACGDGPLIGIVPAGLSAAVPLDPARDVRIERVTPQKLAAGADLAGGVEIVVRATVASWRPESVQVKLEGLPDGAVAPATLALASQPNTARPGATQIEQRLRIATSRVPPGGAKGSFTITFALQDGGELARFAYDYEVVPGTLRVTEARAPTLEPDGIHFALSFDGSRLRYAAPGQPQRFLVRAEGLQTPALSPSTIDLSPEHASPVVDFRLDSAQLCQPTGRVPLRLLVTPLNSQHGQVLVEGSPLATELIVRQMGIAVEEPAPIANLNHAQKFELRIASSSICNETLQVRVVDPAVPTLFSGAGVAVGDVIVSPGERSSRHLELLLGDKPPRGIVGTAYVEFSQLGGNPTLVFPRRIPLTYYVPLWTEEHPDRALAAFGLLTLTLAGIGSAPRILARDPLGELGRGESSQITARRNARWFLISAVVAAGAAATIVWEILARIL